jgi:transcriptional regulator GlxA family with amidase domain
VVVGDFQIMSCAAVAAFDVANIFAGRRFYQVRAISEQGGIARSSIGVAIETARLSGSYDTLLVAGATAIGPSGTRVLAYLPRSLEVASRGVNLHRCVRAGGGGNP